jgi:hypothetical protein
VVLPEGRTAGTRAIVHPWDVVFLKALARGKTTSLGWTIMMFTLSAGITCFILLKIYFFCIALISFDKCEHFFKWTARMVPLGTPTVVILNGSRVCVFLEMGLYRSRIEFLVMFEVVQHCLYENVPHKWWIKKSMITTCNERRINRVHLKSFLYTNYQIVRAERNSILQPLLIYISITFM